MNDYQSILIKIQDRVNGRDLNDFKFRVPVLKFTFLEDGFKIGQLILSVQASDYHYSTPRANSKEYTHVEVGFPNFKFSDAFISKYAEDVENPLDTVYAYVPVEELATELHNILLSYKGNQ